MIFIQIKYEVYSQPDLPSIQMNIGERKFELFDVWTID